MINLKTKKTKKEGDVEIFPNFIRLSVKIKLNVGTKTNERQFVRLIFFYNFTETDFRHLIFPPRINSSPSTYKLVNFLKFTYRLI